MSATGANCCINYRLYFCIFYAHIQEGFGVELNSSQPVKLRQCWETINQDSATTLPYFGLECFKRHVLVYCLAAIVEIGRHVVPLL